MNNKEKPFLKWPGNKYRCIETIINTLPPASRLIEPFTGSGAVFLNSNYREYFLAESNPHLILLFQYLQREGEAFIQYCAGFFTKKNNCATQYYHFRQQFNAMQDNRYKAALFLFLNRHGYNGLCRYNQQGLYNVPFGSYVKPYFPQAEMQHFYQKSQQAQFAQYDFRQTFDKAQPGDLIYCDPPYVPLSKTANFLSYTQKKFDLQDHIELAKLAQTSAKLGITVVISNHDTPFTRQYYKTSKIISFPVKRSISCNAFQRQYAQEILAVFN